MLGHARPCAPDVIELLGEPDDYLGAALDASDLDPLPARSVAGARTVLDRRGHSPLAVLRDALAAGGGVHADGGGVLGDGGGVLGDGGGVLGDGGGVLGVCADAPRRLSGLSSRVGGFALISYHALARDPVVAQRFVHLVALDPPTSSAARDILAAGRGFAHLAWGEPELRFAQQMHELEYGLRASLVAFYRALRLRGRVTGQELEHLLRGDGPHARPARLAARLVKVLAELELVSLDRDLPALAIAGAAPTALERSPAFRVYAQLYEDGRRFLSSPNHLPGG